MTQPLRLVDQIHAVARFERLSDRTETSYLSDIRDLDEFQGRCSPGKMGAAEMGDNITHLAVDRRFKSDDFNHPTGDRET